jgi:hypothetical protein
MIVSQAASTVKQLVWVWIDPMGAAGFRVSREGERVKKPAPAPVMDDGRGWFRTSDLSRVKR